MFRHAAGFFLLSTLAVGAQTTPPGITRTQLLDNESVMVARLRMEPDARETVHTHPFSAVVVQLQPGDVEMRVGTQRETARRETGHVEFIAAEMPHAAANTGTAPFDLVTIALKPDRKPGGTQAAADAPKGITRKPLLDNPQARATHVTFASGAREPVHMHPYDLLVVPLAAARIELLLGPATTIEEYEPGEVIFLPRNVPHSLSSRHPEPFEIVSVGVK
jgi:quercetin dioxygenase-like cupin family protein